MDPHRRRILRGSPGFGRYVRICKNKGRTIGYIIEEYIGKLGKKLFLLFCWLFCILVIAAFADVVAGTFNGFTSDEAGVVSKITANGAVATTSMLFILEAVALGMILKSAFDPWCDRCSTGCKETSGKNGREKSSSINTEYVKEKSFYMPENVSDR